MTAPVILEQKIIESPIDLMNLGIIDWKRTNGFGPSGELLETIYSWFDHCAACTIVKYDLRQASERDDFPDWHHVGMHEPLARLFWNTFHWRHKGELRLGDEPDFEGVLRWEDGTSTRFQGDFYMVSASAFTIAQKEMHAHELWISVLDYETQVIIEPLIDIADKWIKEVTLLLTSIIDRDTMKRTDASLAWEVQR